MKTQIRLLGYSVLASILAAMATHPAQAQGDFGAQSLEHSSLEPTNVAEDILQGEPPLAQTLSSAEVDPEPSYPSIPITPSQDNGVLP
ncbi:MAG: hypothetical protein AAFZ49_12020, partial [Cyanobacteria bacterium J06659_2]